jgi:hypothetical protein
MIRQMKAMSIKLTGVVALGLIGLTTAGQASAGCSGAPQPGADPRASDMKPALYYPSDGERLGFRATDFFEGAPIVGLWEFEFHLNGAQNGFADGALFDWGLATWHSDGTEIQFSAGRPPVAGDVCMGAWREISHGKFELHHIALGLTPPDASGMFVGPAIIRATVTVAPNGASYSGHYSITIYPGSPNDGTEFNESGAPVATFSGTITAKRVVAD